MLKQSGRVVARGTNPYRRKTMVLVRYEPWSAVERLHRQIGQIFGGNADVPAANGDAEVAKDDATATWIPSVDVFERTDSFVVRADLPGIEPKDIQITAERGVLTVSGERKLERPDDQKSVSRLERVEGRFLRRFTLPENVKTDDIRARHLNGVLEVTIPKVAAPEPKRVSVETH
jgi:HSP20 family protein